MADVIKIPPQGIEAEKALLGSLMMDKEGMIKVIDLVRPEDFYKNNHGKIYQAMLDIFEKNEPIDLLTLTQRLKEKEELEEIGGAAYLSEILSSVPTPSHIMYYAKIVREKKVRRGLIQVSEEISTLGYQEEKDIDLILDEAEKKIFGITQESLTQSFLPIKTELDGAFERIDKIHSQKGALRGVTTGFPKLDDMLAGLQRGDFILLASRPSLGKTSLALDIARAAALKENQTVGMFSLEMSKEQLVDRLIASQAGISLWKLRTGKLSADEDFVKIQDALSALSQAPIYIDDAASSTVLQMRAMSRRLQAEKGLGLIIIDYLQLIESRSQSENPVQQVTEISRSLKSLAKELNVPVLALSQLSRAVEHRPDQRPKLSDLRESGCLAGDTLIQKADSGERVSMKELAQRKFQEPIRVLALDDNNKLRPSKMTKVFYSGKKEVFELATESGRKIKASANHPFFKLEGWKRLDELKIGDSIAIFNIPNIQMLATSDIYWDKIVSIKLLGVEDVYDATVENYHNFLANDIVVHNSLEQDADVVLFIYRPNIKESKTELIIAKHRNGPIGKVDLYFNQDLASFRELEKSYEDEENERSEEEIM